ncbi:hypothetical protein B296_00018773 [Ensete ventricosum]|uniref:Uncharacterized protein n=1 Tax=Ensete ventricosum TaxID=4639 RepID=A0A427A8C7_ENSVE|nr:hypothetical protein B296_00018773 [Ensete ventricosum]
MLIRTSGEIWNEEEEETYHDQVFGCIVKQRLRGGSVDLLHQREAEEPLTKQLCLGSVCQHLTLWSQTPPCPTVCYSPPYARLLKEPLQWGYPCGGSCSSRGESRRKLPY